MSGITIRYDGRDFEVADQNASVEAVVSALQGMAANPRSPWFSFPAAHGTTTILVGGSIAIAVTPE